MSFEDGGRAHMVRKTVPDDPSGSAETWFAESSVPLAATKLHSFQKIPKFTHFDILYLPQNNDNKKEF